MLPKISLIVWNPLVQPLEPIKTTETGRVFPTRISIASWQIINQFRINMRRNKGYNSSRKIIIKINRTMSFAKEPRLFII